MRGNSTTLPMRWVPIMSDAPIVPDDPLAGLDSTIISLLRRLQRAPKRERSRAATYYENCRYAEATQLGLVVLRSSPAGRKRWYEITPKGAALWAAINAADEKRERERREADAEIERRERITAAAPTLLAALDALVDKIDKCLCAGVWIPHTIIGGMIQAREALALVSRGIGDETATVAIASTQENTEAQP